jgi:hypothetical protein
MEGARSDDPVIGKAYRRLQINADQKENSWSSISELVIEQKTGDRFSVPMDQTNCLESQKLLHGVSVGVYFVDLAQVQFADTRFHLAHIAHNHPDHVVRLDELFGNDIG